MASCYSCGAWMEYGGTCPSCRRAQDQERKDNQRHRESLQAHESALREQEHLQRQNLQEQQRILSQSAELAHLNDIKRRLLDLSIEGIDNPDKARKKIEIVIRSPEVIGNMEFFRELGTSNLLLASIYNQVAEEIRQREEAERRRLYLEQLESERIRQEEKLKERIRQEALARHKLSLRKADGSVFVGNLTFDATESDLLELFSGIGKVQNVEIVCERDTRRSMGCAFVQLPSLEEANRAVSQLNGKEYMGVNLLVSNAKTDPKLPFSREAEEKRRQAEDEKEARERATKSTKAAQAFLLASLAFLLVMFFLFFMWTSQQRAEREAAQKAAAEEDQRRSVAEAERKAQEEAQEEARQKVAAEEAQRRSVVEAERKAQQEARQKVAAEEAQKRSDLIVKQDRVVRLQQACESIQIQINQNRGLIAQAEGYGGENSFSDFFRNNYKSAMDNIKVLSIRLELVRKDLSDANRALEDAVNKNR